MKPIDSCLPIRTALLIVCIGFLFMPRLSAQFSINENFRGNSVGSNIILGGDPNKASLTSGNGDNVNNGWLRLTTDATNQRGYAYINTSFPSSLGVVIDFEYKTWRRSNDSYNGADGFSVFLFDGAITPETFRIGAYGGSLGYAPSNNPTTLGLKGAYLGIGFDEYGNFAISSEGKNGGAGGTNVIPNSIVLRGPENHSQPYRWLTSEQLQSSASSNTNSIDYNRISGGTSGSFPSSRPTDSQFYRRVKIYIEPIGTITAPKYRIRVLWRTSVDATDTELISYETTDPVPASLKLGFAASTGGGYNYHEIRNLNITTPGGVRVQKSVDKPNAETGEELIYTVDIYNEMDVAIANLKLDDAIRLADSSTAPAADFEITSITFKNNGNTGNTAVGFTSGISKTTGLTNSFTTTLAMAAKSMATFTVKGKAKNVPGEGTFTNTATINPSNTTIKDTNTKITDYDLANNEASATTNIISSALDLKIEKEVDNNGIALQSGNIFTITVSNMSLVAKPASGSTYRVTVTDTIPAGLTVIGWSGQGWTRSPDNNNSLQTFYRDDKLDPLAAYPPITITVKPVSGNPGPWVNTAWVKVQNIPDNNPNNNKSSAGLKWKNYWIGTTSTEWGTASNWTANFVPAKYEDVEFATAANNGGSNGRGTGTAVKDLHLDNLNQDDSGGRIIGNLINNSDKNLVITTGNQLIINGTVTDGNATAGTIVVKSSPTIPTGTLKFTDPTKNKNVKATVEFYNQAFECSTCGLYKNNWQYFGIPVQDADFPYLINAQTEVVNQWVEPFNGNKWRPAPYTPDVKLKAFKGYEITRKSQEVPNVSSSENNALYSFSGMLNVGDASVGLTRTYNVNYAGANLVANSYTAAIPIRTDKTGLVFPTGFDQTVYLFNTGTRDQWRKLNGTAITTNGYRSGQYLAVPVNQGGQGNLPERIPSMHSFMVLYPDNNPPATGNLSANLGIQYDKLEKNTTVNSGGGTQIVTRSASSADKTAENGSATATPQLPVLIMDVVGEQSADRVWIFAKEGTTHGFDNGWDGRKMEESDIAQLYVAGTDKSKLQVATVPDMNSVRLGFVAEADGKYTFDFSLQGTLKGADLFLYDAVTGRSTRINDNGSYIFEAKKGEDATRFRLAYTGNNKFLSTEEALIDVSVTETGKIKVANGSGKPCSVFVSGANGAHLQRVEAEADSETEITVPGNGTYMIRLQSAVMNDVRRVIVQ